MQHTNFSRQKVYTLSGRAKKFMLNESCCERETFGHITDKDRELQTQKYRNEKLEHELDTH